MGDRHVGEKLNAFEDFDEPEDVRPVRKPATLRDQLGSLAGLLLLIGFHAFQAAQWTSHDRRPPGWDQGVQLETAWDLKAALSKGDLKGAFLNAPKPGMPPFPPLFHLSLLPVIGGADAVNGAVWVNVGYLALLAFGLWGLGRHFLGPWEGLGAAVLLTCTPEVAWLSREALVDVALTAWVVCAYWAFAACDGFRKRGPSVLVGLLFAAAMMTKWSAFSYFFPLLVPAFAALQGAGAGGLLAAAAAAFVVGGPWYLAQLPILVPRLFEAAADQAVPLWQGTAFLTYPIAMAQGLELPLFALGLIGAVVPSLRRKTEESWLLPAWFAAALVFWTVVPNRQLRYLLPGLAPLAVLAMGPYPRGVRAAACAVALVSAWNYPRGVIPHLALNAGIPLSVFKSDKPIQEDWRLPEMLKAAQGLREPGTAVSNFAFVANHPRLNGPNLNWELKRLGLPGLRVRGVNKRYTELCEFVLVKEGDLGPASVVNQLPEVRTVMLDPGRWWQRGWGEVKRFKLPDGSEAVLFQRRHPRRAPVGEGKMRIDYYEDKAFTAEGLELDLGRWDPERGVYPRAELKAARFVIRGLEVENVQAVLTGLNFFSADESNAAKVDPLSDPRLTRLDGLELRYAEVREEALAAFLTARVKGLTDASVKFSGGVASLSGVWKGKKVRVALAPTLMKDGLAAGLRSADVMGVPLPVSLFAGRLKVPFAPSSELPFKLVVPSLSIDEGALAIGR
ncbi:hypothetical protein EPO15_02415 [bacterium]|nr:MAG: hypothetical protein EPO15_02415 [bacterium]